MFFTRRVPEDSSRTTLSLLCDAVITPSCMLLMVSKKCPNGSCDLRAQSRLEWRNSTGILLVDDHYLLKSSLAHFVTNIVLYGIAPPSLKLQKYHNQRRLYHCKVLGRLTLLGLIIVIEVKGSIRPKAIPACDTKRIPLLGDVEDRF